MSKDTFLAEMGQRIALRRKERRMTQEQLAEKMGVSLQTVSCIELGKKAIRPENLANLCAHLEVTSDYILFGKRDHQQMSELLDKASALTPEAYSTICHLVDMLTTKA